ncbi:MAG: sigma-70 family RNA polymerase sigma factor [Planctomycetaceae bacterium]|nr:sigma-70 family RNA polymerase sigma factor [Planctomycetaceae bacterium]
MREPNELTDDSSEPLSDLELVRLARRGQWDAFESLLERLEPRVFALAMRLLRHRHDAEDVTQQTFVKVIENLEQFREESSVATWVLRIATNLALTAIRRRRPIQTLWNEGAAAGSDDMSSLSRPQFIAHWRDDPADLVGRAEVRQLLEEALDELDEKYRTVFTLRDIEQFSTRETAEILGITENNVKVRLLRARLQLRERLTHTLGDETQRLEPGDH